MSFMHAFTHSGTLIQHRSIFTCFVHHSHRCWPTGRPAQWDRTPAAPDGAAAPAAKVSMLHNHSQLVCQVTVRSGCPKVVMVRKYEEAAVWEGSYCTLADTVHIEVWKLIVLKSEQSEPIHVVFHVTSLNITFLYGEMWACSSKFGSDMTQP